ncbi:MAG: CRISPR-associated protein Csm7 [Candidatus Accumulibacter sp.]|jgi:CRISPR-associated protein Csm4|nr:CRISPR-associated protein Csm7 [Accumulibacter sp.]
MAYQTCRFILRPQTAFGTPLAGDTLFGQLCWALRHRFGNEWLTERLAGYKDGCPFLVVSDAFPHGFLPLPTVPTAFWEAQPDADRKILKKKRWLPVEKLETGFSTWQSLACDDTDAAEAVLQKYISPESRKGKERIFLQKLRNQPHNSINRATSTTGEGNMFAPHTQTQYWFHPKMRLDLYAVLDETRLAAIDLETTLTNIGQSGFGRDASIGLGKFVGEYDAAFTGLPHAANANAFLTLAPCAPQGQGFVPERSFYQILTRFGRHGDIAARSGNPFKRPLLLAKTSGVFSPVALDRHRAFIGQGLGDVSICRPETVAQGYAPVVGVRMENNAQ